MNKEQTWFNKIIKDIEFRMKRENDKCWIKVVPLKRKSTPTSFHFILNDDYHHWNIYDKDGKENHIIYFKGERICPSFYLKYGKNCFKINCDNLGIKSIEITEKHKLDKFLKENCCCNSPEATCWAKSVYFTSRPDKPPFDEM